MSTSFVPLAAATLPGDRDGAGHGPAVVRSAGAVPAAGSPGGPAQLAGAAPSAGPSQLGAASSARAAGGSGFTGGFASAGAPHPVETATTGEAKTVAFRSVRKPSAQEIEAREAGYSAGFAAGWAAASREEREQIERVLQQRTEAEHAAVGRLDQLRSALTIARETARSMASPVLQMHSDEVVLAAISLAEDLLGVVLADERRRVTAALTRALEIEEDAGVVRVRMNPADVAQFRAMAADSQSTMTLPDGVDLVADPTILPGDAVTELEEGFVDARLSSALSRVHTEFEASAQIERPAERY